MVRNVVDIYQSGQYSVESQKAKRVKGALNILSNSGNIGKTDMVHISDTAHKFSKQSIAALIDKSANTSAQELSFYFSNYNNMEAILYAINFGENVSCGYNPDFKDYGVISFEYNGTRQVIPNYAVPKMNSTFLSGICAKNNSLVLNNQSYYSWTTSSGGRYTWTVNNGRIGWAVSESLLAENTNQKGTNYKWEMRKASNILTALAQGESLYGYDKKDVLSVCEKIGFTPGFISVDAGAGEHHYILQENGKVINVDKKIEQMNSINWIEAGYQEGDVINVYGKEYAIAKDGHIQVSTTDEFTNTEIVYPSREKH